MEFGITEQVNEFEGKSMRLNPCSNGIWYNIRSRIP